MVDILDRHAEEREAREAREKRPEKVVPEVIISKVRNEGITETDFKVDSTGFAKIQID